MKRIFNTLALVSMLFYFNSCEDLMEDSEEDSVAIEGVWVRIIGASGDRTELAIGGIDGEPANRVYMCELKGSTAAGFYKGILTSGNVIVWDDNLPDTYLSLDGSELEFDYKCCGAIPTYYKKGAWSGECGSLKAQTTTTMAGVWVRIIGASGDKTELAIGGIEGEPTNRVYMCELKGSTAAGLYKGTLNSDNVIVWDDNLPNTYLRMKGSELEFDYKCCGALATYYKKGTWTAECGPLKNTTIKLAVGLKNSDFGDVTIKNVTVDGKGLPLTILNSTTTAPDCSSNSFLALPKPAHSNSNGGYYTIGVTYSGQGIDGSYTRTDYMTWYEYYFKTGCNTYKVGMNALGKYDLVPL